MPTSTNIAKYPPGMLDVLEAVCETKKPCTIAYPEHRKAKAERLRFYGLIRALVINKHSLADEAQKLSFNLVGENKKEPCTLIIQFPAETVTDKFYAAIAEQHAANNPPAESAVDKLLKD